MRSPNSTTRGLRISVAILEKSQAQTVESNEPSSTTRVVFAKAVRISFAPFFVKGGIPKLHVKIRGAASGQLRGAISPTACSVE